MTVRKLGVIRHVYTNLSGKRREKQSIWDIKMLCDDNIEMD